MAKKQKQNFLDFVPVINTQNTWDEKDGAVIIHRRNRGFYNRTAQLFFHTTRVSNIMLDAQGSFLWLQMDGRKTVGELAHAMLTRFGSDAEPLYTRLVQYVRILNNNQFIVLRGKDGFVP